MFSSLASGLLILAHRDFVNENPGDTSGDLAMARRQLNAIFFSCFLTLTPLSAESLYYAVDLSDLEISPTPLSKTSSLDESAGKMSRRQQRE